MLKEKFLLSFRFFAIILRFLSLRKFMTNHSIYSFPTFAEFQRKERRPLKRFRSWLRFHWYSWQMGQEITQFCAFLNQHPVWQPLFQEDAYRCDALLRKYCDTRFSPAQRLEKICENFALAEQIFGAKLCEKLVQEKHILLANLTPEWQLYLNINEIDPFEGFFSLNIVNSEQTRLYDASFTFLAPKKCLIASIQGTNADNAQQLMKTATKALHGIRPMFMLVNGFKLFSETLQLDLLGIAHKNQAKYRFNDHSKLLFNYDEFWQENAGTLEQEGYWQIPLSLERKPLEEIQSKKRSMYRKRYAMLDECALQVAQHLKELS